MYLERSSCSANSKRAGPRGAERVRGPSMLFLLFLMKAGMLRETGIVPVAIGKVLVRQFPQDPQPEGRDPSQEEKQNHVCVKSKS